MTRLTSNQISSIEKKKQNEPLQKLKKIFFCTVFQQNRITLYLKVRDMK